MAGPQLISNAQTVPNNPGSTVTTPVAALRTVTYVFTCGQKKLKMPYAVEIGGVVGASFSAAAKKVVCMPQSPNGGKIVITGVPPGTQVRLYLNSDAHPDYRKNPVFAVTPTTRNVLVEIKEKSGHATDTDTLVLQTPAATGTQPDKYKGKLTGITWMKITHKYVSSEVDALIPAGTPQLVIDAVKSVYAGLTVAQLVLNVAGPPARTVTITLEGSNNAVQNIASGYTFLGEGIQRVHPAAYVALFTAAIDSGVSEINVTSGWRPMLGSIAHRAGLGLDLNLIGTVKVNRVGVLQGTEASLNATETEKKLFRKYRETDSAADKAAWQTVMEQNEPAVVKSFRNSLDSSPLVGQIMDPWFIDVNSRDQVPGEINKHGEGNEDLHKDHMHITIHEPKIL